MSSQNRPNRLLSNGFYFFILVLINSCPLAALDLMEISGIVTGRDTKQALAGVTVSFKGSVNSTVKSNDSFK